MRIRPPLEGGPQVRWKAWQTLLLAFGLYLTLYLYPRVLKALASELGWTDTFLALCYFWLTIIVLTANVSLVLMALLDGIRELDDDPRGLAWRCLRWLLAVVLSLLGVGMIWAGVALFSYVRATPEMHASIAGALAGLLCCLLGLHWVLVAVLGRDRRTRPSVESNPEPPD